MSRAQELVSNHWTGYIKPLLESTKAYSDETIALIGFHYTTSGIHFYGHGVEDERKGWTTEGFIKDEADKCTHTWTLGKCVTACGHEYIATDDDPICGFCGREHT